MKSVTVSNAISSKNRDFITVEFARNVYREWTITALGLEIVLVNSITSISFFSSSMLQ